MVYANDFVVGSRREVSTIRRESYGMDRSEMVTHVAELTGFRVGLVVGVVNRFGRPHSNVAIW